jgi:hypothetical protein
MIIKPKQKPIPRFVNPKPVLKKPEMKFARPTEVNSFRISEPEIPPQAFVAPGSKSEIIRPVVLKGKGLEPDMKVGEIDSIKEMQIYKRTPLKKEEYLQSMKQPMRKRPLPQDMKDEAQKNVFKLGSGMDEVEAWQRYDAAVEFEPEKYGQMDPEDFFKQIGFLPGDKRLQSFETNKKDLEEQFWDEEKDRRLTEFGIKPFSAFGEEDQNKIIQNELDLNEDTAKFFQNENIEGTKAEDFMMAAAKSLVEKGLFNTEDEALEELLKATNK